VVWDSLAICEYVNERWLDRLGWPDATVARAVARSAVAEMHSGFAALRTQLPMNVRRQPEARHWDDDAQRDIERVMALWRELRTRFGGEGSFLCGRFGIVDAMFAPVCVRFRGYGVRVDETSAAFMDVMFATQGMRDWVASARAETERVGADEA
jgi:glutathione S-transferase